MLAAAFCYTARNLLLAGGPRSRHWTGAEGGERGLIPDENHNLNWFNEERNSAGAEPDYFDQSPAWQPVHPLGDGRILVLDDF